MNPAILAVRDLCKTYASHDLFDGLSLTFHAQERVGLIGPNGAGKSTLLRILAGIEPADAGVVERAKGARVTYLPQIDAFSAGATVEGALRSALAALPLEGYERPVRARKMLRRLGFENGETLAESLSGGWRKRLAVGCRLVQDPDLLLMDEPTNHLDFDGIDWLERFLERSPVACVVTSHDRAFLERVAQRVVEINPRYRGGYFSVSGHYSDFLEKREAFLEAEDGERKALAANVRREVEWLRRGPKARGTKASYRIEEAKEKIERLSESRRRQHKDADLELDFAASGRKTQDLIVAQGIAKAFGARRLFQELDVYVGRGSRLGIVGNNATGKTTLLRVLLKALSPDAGILRHAAGLRVAVFDQRRDQLDPDERLRRALSPSGDVVSYLGRGMHIIPWAKRFGFRPDQLETPVGELSGGEQARVLMALMLREPVDVLMLDEPTNDLDIGSVEVLERALLEFPGAVVLISHDRQMLDTVCTDLVGLHGDGRWGNYGSVIQWEEAENRHKTESDESNAAPDESHPGKRPVTRPKRSGLSYHEKQEWEGMEERILAAEKEVARLQAQLDDPAMASDHERLQAAFEAHRAARAHLEALFGRWEELEAKKGVE